MARVAVVYHSGYGHTKKQAEAVFAGVQAAGAEAHLVSVADVNDETWALLAGVSGDFKKFADASSKAWFTGQWKDKIAAGFTNSASINGDKYASIQYLWTLSQQHGMIWVGTGMMPANSKAATRNDINYMGGFGGALSQAPSDASPEEGPLPGDLETARLFGERIVAVTRQFVRGRQ
ncbi:flavodoxin family protein [Ralstonia solanacearum]|uniref:flavodoxin family protein n=1 Tax=Ralstonia solanacearum TaxID=305 RepID=UPI0006DD0C38|nr:flavodoxin family protein [Ralstonia solanacearum]